MASWSESSSRVFGVPIGGSASAIGTLSLNVDMDDATVGSGRSIDIELGGQEVITIDLGDLDPNPEDVLDLLKEGQCKVSVWTRLASEYWRRDYLAAADTIARAAIDCMCHECHDRGG